MSVSKSGGRNELGTRSALRPVQNPCTPWSYSRGSSLSSPFTSGVIAGLSFSQLNRPIPNDHESHVVVLVGRPRRHCRQHAVPAVTSGLAGMALELGAQPRQAELLATRIGRLGDAVGIEDEDVAGLQLELGVEGGTR